MFHAESELYTVIKSSLRFSTDYVIKYRRIPVSRYFADFAVAVFIARHSSLSYSTNEDRLEQCTVQSWPSRSENKINGRKKRFDRDARTALRLSHLRPQWLYVCLSPQPRPASWRAAVEVGRSGSTERQSTTRIDHSRHRGAPDTAAMLSTCSLGTARLRV